MPDSVDEDPRSEWISLVRDPVCQPSSAPGLRLILGHAECTGDGQRVRSHLLAKGAGLASVEDMSRPGLRERARP